MKAAVFLLAALALSCSPEAPPRNLGEALGRAREEHKLLLLDFYRDT